MEGRTLRRRGIPQIVCGALAVVAALFAPQAAGAAAPKDYSGTALNIIPSGQYGAIPPPPGAEPRR